MRKLFWLSLPIPLLIGCANFSTQAFRTEQTAVNLVYAAYVAYTNLPAGTVAPPAQEQIKNVRLHFAATVGVLDGLRAAYETNSAVKPQITATLNTLTDQSSNIVWIVNYYKGHP